MTRAEIALGVDWSGARTARRKIWAARVNLEEGALTRIWRPFHGSRSAAEVAARVQDWLASERFDVAGFDFCFGLAQSHLVALDLPRSGPSDLGSALAGRFRDADEFKRAAGRERRRVTDVARGTTFAPTNLRMYRQTYWGLCALSGVELPVPPWTCGSAAVVEVFPRHVRRALGGHADRRSALVATGLQFTPRDVATIVADAEGDALDAVLAAIAAGSALAGAFQGAPTHAATSGEGWIYSI